LLRGSLLQAAVLGRPPGVRRGGLRV